MTSQIDWKDTGEFEIIPNKDGTLPFRRLHILQKIHSFGELAEKTDADPTKVKNKATYILRMIGDLRNTRTSEVEKEIQVSIKNGYGRYEKSMRDNINQSQTKIEAKHKAAMDTIEDPEKQQSFKSVLNAYFTSVSNHESSELGIILPN